ncbi:MAG: pitrilysin family protein [Bacteroidota bacterium]
MAGALCAFVLSCSAPKQDFQVDYEKFTLDNGLEVIFHTDTSDPVTAVALTFHVGSAREKEGKTGFAHLFEHLLFLESENLGKGGLDAMSSRIGGSGANGSTSRDRTNYFQTVPKDALEKMIWAEADKLGYFINTVTEQVVAKEKQVVKNEKRQRVDNAAYGHANYVIGKNLYPEGHPYNWQVIGSLEDLQNATLADVKEFYAQWYVPNNATLVIAGDFDTEQARAWVKKYFDEIPRGEEIRPQPKMPVSLTETRVLGYEDNFARLPEIRMTWPTVETYHPDSYALQILSELLTNGKKAPFNKVLTDEKQLSSTVFMFDQNSEIAGEKTLLVRAYPGNDLDDVKTAIDEAFTRFEEEGFSESDLERIKAGIETDFYNGLSSVLGKAFQLAQYNIFADDPGFINQDIKNVLAVTKDDIQRVYEQYIKGQPYVATSFVPRGQTDLMLSNAQPAEVVEEQIVQGAAGEDFVLPDATEYERTPSSFDRTQEPPYGNAAEVTVPSTWMAELSNEMGVYGIENKELPLVQFRLEIDGGLLLESAEKTGVSNLLAQVMMKGTANKTPEELEEAIDMLGASISVNAGRQTMTISGNSLARNYLATLDLVEEILLEPRWDSTEFELAKQNTLSQIAQQSANPNAIASNVFNKLVYGDDHILSYNAIGTVQSVESITLDDLKSYYAQNISANLADFHIVGAISEAEALGSLSDLEGKWASNDVELPEFEEPEDLDQSKVYFYDVPDAKQSVIRFGYLALPETDEDYYPATVMNYILGGGGFASRLTQELREGKGYTYGIGSGFSGSTIPGAFSISSGVRTNVTYESADLVKSILKEYPNTFSDKDLETTKSFLLKSNARRFETLGAKLNMLQDMSDYGWEADYVKDREQIVRDITKEDIRDLAVQYADADRMIYVVVGDAKTQMDRLEALGYGKPVLVNERFKEGN